LLLQQGNGESGLTEVADNARRNVLQSRRVCGDDVMASLQAQLEDLEAQPGPERPSEVISTESSSAQPRSPLQPQVAISKTADSRDRSSPSPSPETAARIAALEGRLAGMSDAQVEEVFRRLRASMLDKLQSEVRYRRAQQAGRQNTAQGDTLGSPVSVADLTAGVPDEGGDGRGTDLRADLDEVLRDMARDPLRVWQEISEDPDKYLDGGDGAGTVELGGPSA
jgi:hypothetical protein